MGRGGPGAAEPQGLRRNRACNMTLGCNPEGCSQADEDGEGVCCPVLVLCFFFLTRAAGLGEGGNGLN